MVIKSVQLLLQLNQLNLKQIKYRLNVCIYIIFMLYVVCE